MANKIDTTIYVLKLNIKHLKLEIENLKHQNEILITQKQLLHKILIMMNSEINQIQVNEPEILQKKGS